MKFEYPAFVVVFADSRSQADADAQQLVETTSLEEGPAYVSLDEGEPTVEEED